MVRKELKHRDAGEFNSTKKKKLLENLRTASDASERDFVSLGLVQSVGKNNNQDHFVESNLIY